VDGPVLAFAVVVTLPRVAVNGPLILTPRASIPSSGCHRRLPPN